MGWPGMRNVMPGKAHAPMENPGWHSFVSALNFRNWGSDEALPSKNYVFEGLASSGLHFLPDWNMVPSLWNQRLPRDLPSFKKLNLARIGGAHAENQKASRFATAHTRALASGRRKLKSPRRKPSPGAAASTRKTARSATGATAGSLEFLPGFSQPQRIAQGVKHVEVSVCFSGIDTSTQENHHQHNAQGSPV